jgi:hypothetical protein
VVERFFSDSVIRVVGIFVLNDVKRKNLVNLLILSLEIAVASKVFIEVVG